MLELRWLFAGVCAGTLVGGWPGMDPTILGLCGIIAAWGSLCGFRVCDLAGGAVLGCLAVASISPGPTFRGPVAVHGLSLIHI